MYKLCKTEQSALRQKQIEDALLELMGSVRYEDISVSDLCRKLGIPRKAFYRYFSGKDGALFALLDHRLLEYGSGGREEFGVSGAHLSMDFEWFFQFWRRQKTLLDALERSGISGILVERAIRNTQEAVISGLPDRSAQALSAATAFGVCGMMSMVLQWHRDGYSQSVQEMAELTRNLLRKPLVPDETA